MCAGASYTGVPCVTAHEVESEVFPLRGLFLLRLLAAAALTMALVGCSSTGNRTGSFGRPVDKGFKPATQVAPHCRAMVEGRMTLAECMALPESRADGGRACIQAIRDMPARSH